MLRVLGVDLASRSWRDIGWATLEWGGSSWTTVRAGLVTPSGPPTPGAVARVIDQHARAQGIRAIGIDGPHGWRDPDAQPRPGVGRLCEYLARAQGKTGVFGKTYPQTQAGWIRFSIELFDLLLALPSVELANAESGRLRSRDSGPGGRSGYWLLECFPTQTWRSLGLRPLPGKAACSRAQVAEFAQTLWRLLQLPGPIPELTHDDLQAVVAALPAAAALGCGGLTARALGLRAFDAPARGSVPGHRVEGLIWDAAFSTDRR